MSGNALSIREEGGADSIDAERLGVYRAALKAFVSRRLRDPDEVEDLVQEACARLIATAQDRQVQEPQAYLFRIASNLITDLHRRKSAPLGQPLPISEAIEPMAPATQEHGRQFADLQFLLTEALAELSPRCREVFVLRRFDELDTPAIAAQLGISPRMVQKHLAHAMTHLYGRLGSLMRGAR